MSRIAEVIKNKNKIEKTHKARRKDEIQRHKTSVAYKAAIMDELQKIDILLDDPEIDAVVVKVSEKNLSNFNEAMFSDELYGYDIQQMPGKADEFMIQYKLVM
jgi:hypothetical protein